MFVDLVSLNPFEIRAELLRRASPNCELAVSVLIPLKSGLSYYRLHEVATGRLRS